MTIGLAPRPPAARHDRATAEKVSGTTVAAVEVAVAFDCEGHTLIGVMARPAPGTASPHEHAVLIVVGGPQYRAGSHRQFVRLARTLAEAGFPTLRFDVRGMGDSDGMATGFENSTPDIGAALFELQRQCPGARQITLWGLCDGASAALLYLDETADARVTGLALVNPWVRSEATLARTRVRHYYLQRLGQPEFWSKLLSGRVARNALGELAQSVARSWRSDSPATPGRKLPFPRRMARAVARFPGRMTMLLSGRDITAREFEAVCHDDPAWRAALAQRSVEFTRIDSADHTFSDQADHLRMEAATLAWLERGSGTQ